MNHIDTRVTLIGGGIGFGLGTLVASGLTLLEHELAIDERSVPFYLYFLMVFVLMIAVPLGTLGLVIGAVASWFSRTRPVQYLIGAIGSLVAGALIYLTLEHALL